MAFVMGGSGARSGNMVGKFDEGDAWLTSEFFSEPKMVVNKCGSERQLPYEWGRQGDSNLSSPVEYAVGLSDETDEEDDYMACLAQRVAYAMLDDDDDENCGRSSNWVPHQATVKGSFMGRSTQSTLTELEKWSTKMHGGGYSSQLPPSPPCNNAKEDDASAWLLLNMTAAAGFEHGAFAQLSHGAAHEVPSKSYLRATVGELRSHYPRNMQQRAQNVAATCLSRKEFQAKSTTHLGFENAYSGIHQAQQQPQRAWNPRPDEEQNIPMAKQCLEAVNGRQGKVAQAQNRPRLLNRPNPSYGSGNMSGGSGMRAVFLGSNGPGRESGGTGVFLPRRMDNGYTAKAKPACSTVLLPARIVQALNLNVEDLRSQPCVLSDTAYNRRYYGKEMDKRQSVGGDNWAGQQQQQHKGGFYPGCYESQLPSAEISLPQEWTY